MPNQPIYIFGYGASGTNWLLNILDLHHETHCRNSPDELQTSLFKYLPSDEGKFKPGDSFETFWDKAVEWASTHYGAIDRMPKSKKNHLYNFPFDFGMWRMLEKQKVRLMLSLFSPSLALSEWRLPWWLGTRDALKKARPVLKIVQKHNWCQWLTANRLNSPKIHIVRHPGGVLMSWDKRYLAINDHDKVLNANIHRLKSVIDFKPEWGEKTGDLSEISVKEAEMWFWRYSTEELFATGQRHNNYMLTIYENMIANPVNEIRKIYEFCNLIPSDKIIDQIVPTDPDAGTTQSAWYNNVPVDFAKANHWRSLISEADQQIIHKVLSDSKMQDWWD